MQGRRRPRILLVEDDYFLAKELARDLTAAGAEVAAFAPTLERAMSIASGTAEFEAAVLDINLRDETVFPAIDALRARRVPMVFVTGYDATIVPARYRDIPRLAKPADPLEILGALGARADRPVPQRPVKKGPQ